MYNKQKKIYNENSSQYANGGYQGHNQGYGGKQGGGGNQHYQQQRQQQSGYDQYDNYHGGKSGQQQQQNYHQRPQTATQNQQQRPQYNQPQRQAPNNNGYQGQGHYKGGGGPNDMQRPQTANQYQKQSGYQRQQQVQDPEAYRPFDQMKPQGGPGGATKNQQFAQRPQTSTVAKVSNTTAPAVASGQVVQLVSNQYKLKLGGSVQVFQYALKINGLAVWDAAQVQRIIKFKRSALSKALGLYTTSGESIYTITEIDEDVRFDVALSGEKFTIYIDKSTQRNVQFDDKFNNADNSVAQNILNIIIKQGFRDTELKQIGKTPRFFDVNNFVDLKQHQLRIMSGFKASVTQTQIGCTLVVDSIFKFMSTQSCLERISEIHDKVRDVPRARQICAQEFEGETIIANWGNKRQYIVDEVDFELNPVSHKFNHNGEMISIADYFLRIYKLKLKSPKQPLFKVRIAQNEFYLPTELCLIDGVPASMKGSMGMRDALAKTRIDPTEKLKRVEEMVKTLINQKAIKDWNIEVEAEPVGMQSTIMTAPMMVSGKQIVKCDDNSLRKGSITLPSHLLQDEWIMVYDKNRSFDVADKIYNDLCKSANQLQLKVQEPYWIELNKENDRQELDAEIRNYITGGGKEYRHPRIVVFVLQRENNYEMFKEVMLTYSIPSQVITARNGNKFNLSKATNILRQINSKAGGDLYHLKFPPVLDKKRTMLIGIDVCHAGAQSVVGFSASINPDKSQYYSNYIIQRKGQEIVKEKMNDYLEEAIESFNNLHKGYPTNFIIFRDGVGDAQRDQVLSKEIPQFEEAINKMYNKASSKPEITVVVVNKRISQRFFMLDKNGRKVNPPPGCIIDSTLVQDHEPNSKKFDFFMTPALCTQGCVLPTHFYVPKNDSCMSKKDIQQLTYTLCYYYFNWAGSIKVPAPCQYAHKIAEFYTNINVHRKKQGLQICGKEALAVKNRIEAASSIVPINNRLHFL